MTAHQQAVETARKLIIVRSSRHKPGGGYRSEAERRRPMSKAEFQREAERLLIEALEAGTFQPSKARAGEAEILSWSSAGAPR